MVAPPTFPYPSSSLSSLLSTSTAVALYSPVFFTPIAELPHSRPSIATLPENRRVCLRGDDPRSPNGQGPGCAGLADSVQGLTDLPRWVRSVLKEEWTAEVFDQELLRYKSIEEELVSVLHVGLACVLPMPDKRPTMTEVVKMIKDIRVDQSPLGEECDESRDSLSPSLATTAYWVA